MRGLPTRVKELLDKARESALLAVEVYNKPTATFRSGAYIILMTLAWGALLQAIFYRKRISCFEKHSNGRYVKVEGEKKAWSTDRSVKEYFKAENDPMRKNLEFLIALRNKLEHRSYPEIDDEIFGECQAALMNFEEILLKEFPKETQLKQNLVFAIQFSKMYTPEQEKSITKKIGRDLSSLKAYIERYRATLGDEEWKSQKFSFRVTLLPKVGNNITRDGVAVEFIKYDPSKPEEMARLEKLGVLIKQQIVEKEKIVPSQEIYKFKPGQIAIQVKKAINKPFTTSTHTNCWKIYGVRPASTSVSTQHKNEHCLFDEAHKDFVYSQTWIDFLIKELTDPEKYKRVVEYKSS